MEKKLRHSTFLFPSPLFLPSSLPLSFYPCLESLCFVSFTFLSSSQSSLQHIVGPHSHPHPLRSPSTLASPTNPRPPTSSTSFHSPHLSSSFHIFLPLSLSYTILPLRFYLFLYYSFSRTPLHLFIQFCIIYFIYVSICFLYISLS